MGSALPEPATGTCLSGWGEREIPSAEAIHRAKEHVMSSTLDAVDWNAELVRGDSRRAVERLKAQPGEGLWVGGVTLPRALSDRGTSTSTSSSYSRFQLDCRPTLLAGLRSA
jgi:hypothetical protein